MKLSNNKNASYVNIESFYRFTIIIYINFIGNKIKRSQAGQETVILATFWVSDKMGCCTVLVDWKQKATHRLALQSG